jgi:hypothetical protein
MTAMEDDLVVPVRTFLVYVTRIDGESVRRTYFDADADSSHGVRNCTDAPKQVVIRREGAQAVAFAVTLEVGQHCNFECIEGELDITIDTLRSIGSSH